MSMWNRLKNRVLASLLCVMATVAFAGCADPAAAPSGDTPSNIAPAAVFSTNCTLLDCSFDAAASTDPDGSVDVYSWDFGDGASAGDIKPNHSYGAEGDYTITLTVADDDGATSYSSQSVSEALLLSQCSWATTERSGSTVRACLTYGLTRRADCMSATAPQLPKRINRYHPLRQKNQRPHKGAFRFSPASFRHRRPFFRGVSSKRTAVSSCLRPVRRAPACPTLSNRYRPDQICSCSCE